MEYIDHLPPKYREAFDELFEKLNDAPDHEAEKKLFDEFSQKYTMVAYLWRRRIMLEFMGAEEPLSLEVLKECFKTREKAFKHFYHPWYIQARLTDKQERMVLKKLPQFGRAYRLPYSKNIWAFCEVLMKKSFHKYSFDLLKKYLIFPHDQLYRFYRFIQVNSAKSALEASLKKKYDAAVESYNYMISIAFDSEKWLEWMKETFDEEDWILNLECKISEHFFMKEIWFFYIEYLDSKNKVAVLDVYKRYCRLFVEDEDMKMQYSKAIEKYDSKFHVFRWQCDQEEFEWDFETKENGCPKLENLLETVPHCICADCFQEKNAKFFDGKLKGKADEKSGGIFSKILKKKEKKKEKKEKDEKLKLKNCILCYEKLEKEEIDLNDDGDDDESPTRDRKYRKAITFQPDARIKFTRRHGRDLPLPKPFFQYIVQNANENVLSKFYECSKYFFAARLYLLCGSIYCGNFAPEFVRNSYYTNVEHLSNLKVKKLCCGTNLVFFDRIDQTSLSVLLPKLCCCTLVNVVLVNQTLTIVEFDLIIDGGKLEQIDIDKSAILHEDGSDLTVEDLIEKLPNIAVFGLNPLRPAMFTTSTTEKLSKLVRTVKFEHFEIWNIPNTFELSAFVKFMELHMVPRATMILWLQPGIDDAYDEMFSQFRFLVRNKWNPIYAAPQINQ